MKKNLKDQNLEQSKLLQSRTKEIRILSKIQFNPFFYCSIFVVELPRSSKIFCLSHTAFLKDFAFVRRSKFCFPSALIYIFSASSFKTSIHLISSSVFFFIRVIFLSTNFCFLEITLSSNMFMWAYSFNKNKITRSFSLILISFIYSLKI